MDSETSPGVDTAPETPVAGPGAALRAAREAMRLDLSHIAAETRIPLRHLQSIEEGQFAALPSRTYALGFARTYAKAVRLDPEAVADAIRGELADGPLRRTVPAPGMEPGDPARLPSSGLAWAAGAAVLIFAIGAFAFFRSYFSAGVEPGSLLPPEPVETATAAAAAAELPSGPVVLTATEDGVWVRLYEEGGERLTERTLTQGETIEVPPAARDPRINTGRPDALAITIGGRPVARLAEIPQTVSGMPVSAAALTARGAAPVPEASASPVAAGAGPVRPRARPRPRPQATGDAAAPAPEAAPAPAPAPVAPPAEAPAPTTR
jgi:cytoskeletal protein RodZ